MGMAAALVRNDAERAAIGVIVDPEAAAAAHEAGEGAIVTLALGAKSRIPGDAPLVASFTVEKLSDGRFVAPGPFYGGSRMNLGPSACLRIGGVRIVVGSRKAQLADRAMYRQVGIEPEEQAILVNKSSVHFRADFEPIDRRDDPRLRGTRPDAGRSGGPAMAPAAPGLAHIAARQAVRLSTSALASALHRLEFLCPFCRRSIIRLSPGRVFTVSAGPASIPPLCIGRSCGPPAVMRDIESLTLATGSERKRATTSALTARSRFRMRKPIISTSSGGRKWMRARRGRQSATAST